MAVEASRRSVLQAGLLVPAVLASAQQSGWTREWDRALLEASLAKMAAAFDEEATMLATRVGPEYRYHSALRSQQVHPTRESLHYALLLLEDGAAASLQRAFAITGKILGLQDTDSASKWYGLWGWYLEEPAARMQPADWNWADFLGSILILIRHRHGEKLSPSLRARVEDGIRHSAYSVVRRNVSMGYTNIAIKGTFVTLAASDILGDASLRNYARERLVRLSREIDRTGSFNEYNSPTYNRVGLENFVRMRMVWKDEDAVEHAKRMEQRMWDHLSRRWHANTRQVAGPMSRCYSTDIGQPLWLQKGLGNRLRFSSLDEIRSSKVAGDAETAYIDFKCPREFESRFLEPGKGRQVRELFLASSGDAKPTQGSTWLSPDFSLGSISQGDFWVQRRPLLAYWLGDSGQTCYAQLRVMKDDYDFSSALFQSVQQDARVLGVLNFRNPGGDKHISLDPIENGRFRARSLRLQLDIVGMDPDRVATAIFAESSGFPRWETSIPFGRQILVFSVLRMAFSDREPGVYTRVLSEGKVEVHCPWFGGMNWESESNDREVIWDQTGPAFAVLSVAVLDGGRGNGNDSQAGQPAVEFSPGSGLISAAWGSGERQLSIVAGGTVASLPVQQKRFDGGRIGGKPVPIERLSDVRLAGLFSA